MSKSDIDSWATVATFVATFPSDDGDGACDVEVQVGESDGAWHARATDDAGGDDDAPDTAYASREAAVTAAKAYAAEHDEGGGSDAEEYLDTRLAERAGKPSAGGEYCVYWATVGDDAHVVARYATEDAAEAAAEIANNGLHASHPGGHLLCGHEVRRLVDGEWLRAPDEA